MGTPVVILLLVLVVILLLRRSGGESANHSQPAPPAAKSGRASAGGLEKTQSAYRADIRARGHTVTSRSSLRASPERDPIPAAEPGMKRAMFTYGGHGVRNLTRTLGGPYAVIDFQTTGLAPRGSDRIIEVAVVRIEDGVVGEPWCTLVNPGRDTGASFIHHIETADVANAPTFAEVAPYLLSQLDGAVVVAHNATFDEEFLAAELARAGHRGLRMPALCTLWLSRQTFATSNHRLPSLARALGVTMTRNDSRDHVLATAAVLRHGLGRHKEPVLHGCEPYRWTGGPVAAPKAVFRVTGVRKGTEGYMSSLMSKLPSTTADVDSADEQAYLELLTAVMADGQISRDEAQQLGRLAGDAGMSRATIAALNERFLEQMREAAFADEVLTAAELRELKRAAKALGAPTYFDDLAPTPSQRTEPGDGCSGTSAKGERKCGHCGQPGHYRPTCPTLAPAAE